MLFRECWYNISWGNVCLACSSSKANRRQKSWFEVSSGDWTQIFGQERSWYLYTLEKSDCNTLMIQCTPKQPEEARQKLFQAYPGGLFEINNKDVDVKTSCPLLSLSPLMRRKIKYIKLNSHLVELIEVPTTESLHRLTVVRPHQLEEEDLEVARPGKPSHKRPAHIFSTTFCCVGKQF